MIVLDLDFGEEFDLIEVEPAGDWFDVVCYVTAICPSRSSLPTRSSVKFVASF